MKVVVQRVARAQVSVDGGVTGRIGKGLLLFVGIHDTDDENVIRWVVEKVLRLRIFPDDEGRMNRSVTEAGEGILVISQFTLYGDVSRGTRPSFIEAAAPEKAEEMYDRMISVLKKRADLEIQSGIFGAMMNVELVNDGPVTILIEKQNRAG